MSITKSALRRENNFFFSKSNFAEKQPQQKPLYINYHNSFIYPSDWLGQRTLIAVCSQPWCFGTLGACTDPWHSVRTGLGQPPAASCKEKGGMASWDGLTRSQHGANDTRAVALTLTWPIQGWSP